jgi:hypothetical protein
MCASPFRNCACAERNHMGGRRRKRGSQRPRAAAGSREAASLLRSALPGRQGGLDRLRFRLTFGPSDARVRAIRLAGHLQDASFGHRVLPCAEVSICDLQRGDPPPAGSLGHSPTTYGSGSHKTAYGNSKPRWVRSPTRVAKAKWIWLGNVSVAAQCCHQHRSSHPVELLKRAIYWFSHRCPP